MHSHQHAEHTVCTEHGSGCHPLLTLSGVCMGWDGHEVLHDINLIVHRGDFITITGPNGGGKTTLLRIMLGLLKPVAGRVVRELADMRIGYLPQKNMIDSHFPVTVREVMMSGLLGVRGLSRQQRDEAYARTMDRVALHEHEDQPIGELSGGQLQRALLGRAIIAGPGLLVLDEPLSYIDQRFEARLNTIIGDIARTTTIIQVTHQMTALAAMSTRHFIVDRTLHECHASHHSYHTDCE
ncbi:MAG: metal ABC transporter ATP-binding protein [Muribaculaceae bacterium]